MFDYTLDFRSINFRDNPHLYQIGKGEQGVLLVEPYKSEILPHWRFKTPDIARASSEKIYQLFLEYKEQQDFVGMDMARKFLQMGYTRSRRYANHKSGQKYAANPQMKESEEAQKETNNVGTSLHLLSYTPCFFISLLGHAFSRQPIYISSRLSKHYLHRKKRWIASSM